MAVTAVDLLHLIRGWTSPDRVAVRVVVVALADGRRLLLNDDLNVTEMKTRVENDTEVARGSLSPHQLASFPWMSGACIARS